MPIRIKAAVVNPLLCDGNALKLHTTAVAAPAMASRVNVKLLCKNSGKYERNNSRYCACVPVLVSTT